MDPNLITIPEWTPSTGVRNDGHSILVYGGQATGKTTTCYQLVAESSFLYVLTYTDRGESYQEWKQITKGDNKYLFSVLTLPELITMPPGWIPPKLTKHTKDTDCNFEILPERTIETTSGRVFTVLAQGLTARVLLWLIARVFHINACHLKNPVTIVLDDVLTHIGKELERQNMLISAFTALMQTLRHAKLRIVATTHVLNDTAAMGNMWNTLVFTSWPSLIGTGLSNLIAGGGGGLNVEEIKRFYEDNCARDQQPAQGKRIPRANLILDQNTGAGIWYCDPDRINERIRTITHSILNRPPSEKPMGPQAEAIERHRKLNQYINSLHTMQDSVGTVDSRVVVPEWEQPPPMTNFMSDYLRSSASPRMTPLPNRQTKKVAETRSSKLPPL
jgi:hypothetical protein